jgi:integrase
VATALRTGLRRRTLLSLRWQDADLKGGTWNIPGEAMKTARPYTQPIAPSVVAELTAYRRRLLEKKGATAVKPGAPIFQLGAGATFKRAFKSAVERAGLKGLTFHGLRAAFLNRLRDRGIPIDVAAELTGHASLQVLMKHYREVPAAETRKAVQALDQVEAKEAKA